MAQAILWITLYLLFLRHSVARDRSETLAARLSSTVLSNCVRRRSPLSLNPKQASLHSCSINLTLTGHTGLASTNSLSQTETSVTLHFVRPLSTLSKLIHSSPALNTVVGHPPSTPRRLRRFGRVCSHRKVLCLPLSRSFCLIQGVEQVVNQLIGPSFQGRLVRKDDEGDGAGWRRFSTKNDGLWQRRPSFLNYSD